MSIEIITKGPSDQELVRTTLLGIINGKDNATPYARIQASKLLLDIGQENPDSEVAVGTLYDTVRDALQGIQDAIPTVTPSNADRLLAALQEFPKGLSKADALDLLDLTSAQVYRAYKVLEDQGLATFTGASRARRWIAV